MRQGLRHRSGFTLAEAIIAMTILAAAAGSVLLPFAVGAAEQNESAMLTLSAKLAADKLEDIGHEVFSLNLDKANNFIVENEIQGQVKDTNGVVFSGDIYSRFSRTASYQLAAGWFPHPLIRVTVDVAYEGRTVISASTWLGDQ